MTRIERKLTLAAGGASNTHAGHVLRCTATNCGYNRQGDCDAPNGIVVVFDGNHADCDTYTENSHHVGAGSHPTSP